MFWSATLTAHEKEEFTVNHSKEQEPHRDATRSGKGFYIALAVCMLAIAGVTAATFFGPTPASEQPGPTTTRSTWKTAVTTTDKPVAGEVTGVPDTRKTTTTIAVTTTTTAAKQSLFVLPSTNVILLEFSNTPIYSETMGEWCTHNGVDFEAAIGSDVKAMADGTVSAIKEDPLWGVTVEIDHGDKLMSRYCGVKPMGLQAGDKVTAGAVIGTVTEIPAEIVSAAHLHVEVLANGKYVDPMTLIRGETK